MNITERTKDLSEFTFELCMYLSLLIPCTLTLEIIPNNDLAPIINNVYQEDTLESNCDESNTTGGSYTVHMPFFYDQTPPGSYDFTLAKSQDLSPHIPAIVSGYIAIAENLGGYGNYVAIEGDDGKVYIYAHLQHINVYPGQRIMRHESIGKQGSTGNSTGNHIHMEIWTALQTKGGYRITDRSITEPILQRYIEELKSQIHCI